MAASNSQSFSSNSALSDTTQQPLKYLQEFPLSQECKDLMSTLPTAKGWLTGQCYQYQGHWYDPEILQSTLNVQKHFEAHDTDILLVTPPKSGTTWLKALTYAIVNRGKYPINAHNKNHPLFTTNPHELVPFLERNLYLETTSPDLSYFTPRRIFATHVPLGSLPDSIKNSKCKIVYPCRDIKDTFVSGWHFVNQLKPKNMESLSLEEALDMFCVGNSPYGPLWDHIYQGMEASSQKPEKVIFLKYEELKEQPQVHLKHLAEFIGYPFSAEEEKMGLVDEILKLCGFDSLANLEVNKSGTICTGENSNSFFRKGQVGDWKNYLTPEMASRIDQVVEQKFRGGGPKMQS